MAVGEEVAAAVVAVGVDVRAVQVLLLQPVLLAVARERAARALHRALSMRCAGECSMRGMHLRVLIARHHC